MKHLLASAGALALLALPVVEAADMQQTAAPATNPLLAPWTGPYGGVPPFDRHVKSAEMFDAEKHPTIKFVSDKFSFNGDKVSEVTGQLTLLGKTAPVTLKATQFNCYDSPMLKREVCGGDFEATIDRTQWGMNYGVEWGFPKNVRLVVQIEAIKQ